MNDQDSRLHALFPAGRAYYNNANAKGQAEALGLVALYFNTIERRSKDLGLPHDPRDTFAALPGVLLAAFGWCGSFIGLTLEEIDAKITDDFQEARRHAKSALDEVRTTS